MDRVRASEEDTLGTKAQLQVTTTKTELSENLS